MGKIDVAAGDYLADAAVFADTFYFFLYDGKEVIRKEQLSEMNPASLHIAAGRTGSTGKKVFRDILKVWNCKRDDSSAYMLLGIESQAKVHYAMPVRAGLYDFLQYDAQLKNTAKNKATKTRWPQSPLKYVSMNLSPVTSMWYRWPATV